MGRSDPWKTASAVCIFCLASAVALPAQTFTTLHRFDGPDGDQLLAGLVQATDGNLYGTTAIGGANNGGMVFRLTPTGTLTTLYSFCSGRDCSDGVYPQARLIQATNGSLYGTTDGGGAKGRGTIFSISLSGTLTTLYSFCAMSGCTDGQYPYAGLVQGTDGNFYGTTTQGGASGGGTVFKVTPDGTLTSLYSFCSQSSCADGAIPYSALVQATDGNYYGTTQLGGAGGEGTVFRITPCGTLTTLHSFDYIDGGAPQAGLVQAVNGNLYGTTMQGGAHGLGGTAFEMTPSGTLTTLYDFCSQSGCTDGIQPYAGLVQATDGNFYGTTQLDGANGNGTIFEITPGGTPGTRGTLTTLYDFCAQKGCTDGASPMAALVQETSGGFYGTTSAGGSGSSSCSHGCGTVFSLSVGLGPFVEPQTTSGNAGAMVKILGSDLRGATSVTFNGAAATFTVESSSLIRATVPVGATTGKVQVVTPHGTLSSNAPFRVLP